MHTDIELQNWKNPVLAIKDPLKRRWAEIVQSMNTHINGICPIHIYYNRRPLESTNTYALAYRVNNFEPITKEAFDRAINGIVDLSKNANVNIKVPENILNTPYDIKEVELYEFCTNNLIRIRESDPNAVIVVMPKVSVLDNQNVSVNGVEILFVESKDIDKITKHSIRFKAGDAIVNDNRYDYFISIDHSQYTLEYPDSNGQLQNYAIVKLEISKPYINISSNIVHEGKYTLRLPYLYGSAALGNKFYGQESDFTVQATRYTYIKEIRAKEKCDQAGYIDIGGVHCSSENNSLKCGKCGGIGYVKDDSPLGTIYVDFDKLRADNQSSLPSVVTYAEPPQSALINSKKIVDDYYSAMEDSLGLVKRNDTNQSGTSKDFDWRGTISMVYNILLDNIRVLKLVYQSIEEITNNTEPTSDVYLVGEIGKSTLTDLLVMLKNAKTNQSPPSVITSLVIQILQKQLSGDISDSVINVAKVYDKLFIYGSDELTTARAQFGSYITNKDVYVHNTIITVIEDYLAENGIQDEAKITAYLDDYYTKIFPVTTDLMPVF